MGVSDKSIIQAIKSNKKEAMHLLFEKYFAQLVVYAEYLVRDKGMAEDIVQDLFVRLWQVNYLEKYKGVDLKYYLFRSTKNACLTYLKKQDLLKNPVDLKQIEIPDEVFFDINEEKIKKVGKELEKLPDRTQQVVKRVMVHRMKYQEVADEMSISINTVKSLLKDGIKKLRKNLLDTTND